MRVDWRTYLDPVKDQGECGSCVAHGVCKAWEGMIQLKKNMADGIEIVNGVIKPCLVPISDPKEDESIDLSERHLFSCCGGSCDQGTTMQAALNQALNGVALEEDCPYDARDHRCGEGLASDWWRRGRLLGGWAGEDGYDAIRAALAAGPLAATMPVHQSFMVYLGGVYHNLGVFDPVIGYHCVCLAGYDDEDEGGYWIIRNSWGTGWGEYGDCRMRWDELDLLAYSVAPSDNPIPEPEPEPSPCPVGNAAARALNVVPWALGRRGRFYYRNP